jgi:hypothetical protein
LVLSVRRATALVARIALLEDGRDLGRYRRISHNSHLVFRLSGWGETISGLLFLLLISDSAEADVSILGAHRWETLTFFLAEFL